MSQKKDRYFRIESSLAQEFVIIAGDGEPSPEHGFDLRKWPTRVELTEAEFETRHGERAPNAVAAAEARRAVRIMAITIGELEDIIDARITALDAKQKELRDARP